MCETGFCLACIGVILLLRYCLVRENAKLQQIEIQHALEMESEKARGEEIMEARAVGGLLVLNARFRYAL